MSDSGPAARAGSWFGPYRLVRLLRQGGMGEVYEAEDTRKGRMVALKLISQQFSGNAEFRARLQREADIAGRLTEPHVVPTRCIASKAAIWCCSISGCPTWTAWTCCARCGAHPQSR